MDADEVAVPVLAEDVEKKRRTANYCNILLILGSIVLFGLLIFLIVDTVQMHIELNASATQKPCKLRVF